MQREWLINLCKFSNVRLMKDNDCRRVEFPRVDGGPSGNTETLERYEELLRNNKYALTSGTSLMLNTTTP